MFHLDQDPYLTNFSPGAIIGDGGKEIKSIKEETGIAIQVRILILGPIFPFFCNLFLPFIPVSDDYINRKVMTLPPQNQ